MKPMGLVYEEVTETLMFITHFAKFTLVKHPGLTVTIPRNKSKFEMKFNARVESDQRNHYNLMENTWLTIIR
jgi:hypothetical protein